ncbi:MAG: ribosomal RNA small subunit methyltransferase A [Candidatus Kerfeldbacteria bacterium RIFCSPLOWO2_01_FULL_48_11]|uniref:Ribosomal RNA small subunit methyltransferase A n=1 Tax=Candidatus Kerfeldbacteria bacterium RIFCSPLOWO2_01_FULL_48_11 TaxID=1798543 RepID=A0A1G2B6I4_9BACT|nr:MAG: Ribosomal RNA small subunit methyltransferase A [Parcubacteria group bacterium GW2011_GWC2_49_9]OGY84804.1 MAG: ribosomal RNA small subunit methyltransferase A [Candidatus Kerfeldbacteria bacterium RIFCSPLOWO2_01_FULL_48_11]
MHTPHRGALFEPERPQSRRLKARVVDICRRESLRPQHDLGQHFLVDERVLADIVEAASLEPRLPILEIGPGIGVLTEALARFGVDLTAVELDTACARYLARNFHSKPHVHIIQGDALGWWERSRATYTEGEFDIAANLPFNIASHVLNIFLSSTPRPRAMTVLLQKEVAQRTAASPGSTSMLSLMAQSYADVHIVRTVKRSAFWPMPKVDAALVTFRDIHWRHAGIDEKVFFKVARAGFSARRKKLRNNLAGFAGLLPSAVEALLLSIGISENARAQELSLEEWRVLMSKLTN